MEVAPISEPKVTEIIDAIDYQAANTNNLE
jgi:hypothetical protein